MRRYIICTIVTLSLLLSLAIGLSAFGIGACASRDRYSCGLYRFQQSKIETSAAPVDTVMFGDSSLGNDVDAKTFMHLRGKPTLNLALNGAMGFPVVYLQMQDAFEKRKVRNAIVMLSPEAFRHGFNRGAEFYVSAADGRLSLLYGVSKVVGFQSTLSLVKMLFDKDVLNAGVNRLLWNETDIGECRGCANWDYVLQSNKHVAAGEGDLIKWQAPRDDFDPFLKRIASLCQEYDVNCVYVHGPIMREVLDLNPTYVAKINQKIEGAGLNLAATDPIEIPADEVGNAVNHVRPDLRPAYTLKVYQQVQAFLR